MSLDKQKNDIECKLTSDDVVKMIDYKSKRKYDDFAN